MPWRRCLPEWNGRSAVTRSMGIKVPSITTYACPVFFAFASARRSLGDRAASRPRRFRDVSPGGGGADAESGGQLGECLALAQVGQRQQRLLSGGQLAPGRADLSAVAADDPGGVGEGLAR
jgi:hypothetical protein